MKKTISIQKDLFEFSGLTTIQGNERVRMVEEVQKIHDFLLDNNIIPKEVKLLIDYWESNGLMIFKSGERVILFNPFEIDLINEEYEDLGEFAHIKVYLHEAGHTIHSIYDYQDFKEKMQIQTAIQQSMHENMLTTPKKMRHIIYKELPGEKAADTLAENMWNELRPMLKSILGG